MLLFSFMQVCARSSSRVHFVYLHKQPIGVTNLGHSPVRLNNRYVRGRHWLTAAKYIRHVMTKAHCTCINLTQQRKRVLLNFYEVSRPCFHAYHVSRPCFQSMHLLHQLWFNKSLFKFYFRSFSCIIWKLKYSFYYSSDRLYPHIHMG